MIVDCYLYHGEQHAATIRHHELKSMTGATMIFVGNRTFQGDYERMTNESFPTLPEQSGPIIISGVELPRRGTPWERESFLRRAALLKAQETFPDAHILLSDCDEIPRAQDVARAWDMHVPVRLPSARHFYWTVDWELPECITESAPFMVPPGVKDDGQSLRKGECLQYSMQVLGSGWHFSFLGDVAFAQTKLQSFAHARLNTPSLVDEQRLEECIRLGLDPDPSRNAKLLPVDLTGLPRWVQENPEWLHRNNLSRSDWK